MQSDGCTSWPDSWFGVDHRACCERHDLAYRSGGGDGFWQQAQRRLAADWALAQCVATHQNTPMGWLNAGLMFLGVRVGGWRHWRWQGLKGWHWGYGHE